tara:strand:- start:1192 stop:1374 length:183 start_codon:yes stop_codon:yes gene_type:complete
MTKITRGVCEPIMTYRARVVKERMMQDVVDAETLEDVKILLLDWIDDGSVQRRIPPPWEK